MMTKVEDDKSSSDAYLRQIAEEDEQLALLQPRLTALGFGLVSEKQFNVYMISRAHQPPLERPPTVTELFARHVMLFPVGVDAKRADFEQQVASAAENEHYSVIEWLEHTSQDVELLSKTTPRWAFQEMFCILWILTGDATWLFEAKEGPKEIRHVIGKMSKVMRTILACSDEKLLCDEENRLGFLQALADFDALLWHEESPLHASPSVRFHWHPFPRKATKKWNGAR